MNVSILPIVLLSVLQTPIPTEYAFSYPLGTEIPLSDFPFHHQQLDQAIELIDPLMLGTTVFSINQETIEYTFTVTITNDGVIMNPLVGEKSFISSLG